MTHNRHRPAAGSGSGQPPGRSGQPPASRLWAVRLKEGGRSADAPNVQFERLVIESGDNSIGFDLHPRLTVIAGLSQMERDGLVNEFVGALGNSRSGVHLELVAGNGNRFAIFRPNGAPHRVIDVDRKVDVTAQFTDAAGRSTCCPGPGSTPRRPSGHALQRPGPGRDDRAGRLHPAAGPGRAERAVGGRRGPASSPTGGSRRRPTPSAPASRTPRSSNGSSSTTRRSRSPRPTANRCDASRSSSPVSQRCSRCRWPVWPAPSRSIALGLIASGRCRRVGGLLAPQRAGPGGRRGGARRRRGAVVPGVPPAAGEQPAQFGPGPPATHPGRRGAPQRRPALAGAGRRHRREVGRGQPGRDHRRRSPAGRRPALRRRRGRIRQRTTPPPSRTPSSVD